jgi:5-methylcytosine-specific restriction enzyme subunit McrC
MPAPSHKPRIFPCVERQSVEVPLNDLLTATGKFEIWPIVASKGYFDIDYRGGQLVFKAGKFVGLIPINDRVVIDVKPKVSVADLLHIVDVAEEEVSFLGFFIRPYKEQKGVEDSLLGLMVRTLLKQLHQVENEGVYKTYVRVQESGTFKPRINFSRTMQREWCRGNFSRTSNEVFHFTRDHALNRLIKFTIWYCGHYLELRSGASEIREELNFFYNLFENVPLDLSRSFLADARSTVESSQIPLLRNYYLGIAKTCLLIIGDRSVSLETAGSDVTLLSFILNLEDVFEKYVRNVLRQWVKTEQSEVKVRDGNKGKRNYLFHDSRVFDIYPDIYLTMGAKRPLVADVKYKPKIDEHDRYQVISHSVSMGAKKAVIIVPAFQGGNSGLIRRGQICDANGIEVFEYHMKLDGDLASEEAKMGKAIIELGSS